MLGMDGSATCRVGDDRRGVGPRPRVMGLADVLVVAATISWAIGPDHPSSLNRQPRASYRIEAMRRNNLS